MPKLYKCGTRNKVAEMMTRYAIRDQEALIESLSTYEMSEEDKQAVKETEECIDDFKRLYKSITGGEFEVS